MLSNIERGLVKRLSHDEPAALAENPSLVAGTHVRRLSSANPAPGDLTPLSISCGYL